MADRLTPIKAIRAKCLDCMCGSSYEVELCPCGDCPLFPYRFGKNPYIILSDEERERRAERGRAAAAKLRKDDGVQ